MRQAAAQAGYLGADVDHAMATTSVNDLLNAVGSDRPVHSVHDEAAVDAWNRYDGAKADYARAQSESEGRSSGATALPSRAPLSAYSRDDIEGPSGSFLPSPARSGLTPNFGPEAANRLKAANAAYAEYAKTYKNPTVGPGLRTTGYSGQYQRSGRLVHQGCRQARTRGLRERQSLSQPRRRTIPTRSRRCTMRR